MKVDSAQRQRFDRIARLSPWAVAASLLPSALSLHLVEHSWRAANMTAEFILQAASACCALLMLLAARAPVSNPSFTSSGPGWQAAGARLSRLVKRSGRTDRLVAMAAPAIHASLTSTDGEKLRSIALAGERSRQACRLSLHCLGWLAAWGVFVLCHGLRP